jgi:PAS domain S-box-containing protein
MRIASKITAINFEGWIHSTGRATRDSKGQVVRWSGANRDVTARRRTEQALRESEDRHARAMEGSDSGHWDWNILTDELFVSERAREMLALPPGPLPMTRTEFMKLMAPHDQVSMKTGTDAAIRGGTYEREYRIVPRDGSVRWLRSRGKVFRDAGGTALRMTGSVTDITEAKRAEEALRSMGFRVCRVRHHELAASGSGSPSTLARLEIAPEELSRALEPAIRSRIVSEIRAVGYQHVTIDLQGYRMGSLNEGLRLDPI